MMDTILAVKIRCLGAEIITLSLIEVTEEIDKTEFQKLSQEDQAKFLKVVEFIRKRVKAYHKQWVNGPLKTSLQKLESDLAQKIR